MVVQTESKYARPLARMQSTIFPTLLPEELYSEQHYLRHMKLFPEGQFTALVQKHDKWIVAGSTVTFRVNWSLVEKPHTFEDIIDGGWLSNHDPHGEWLYGGDMSVHPDFRGLGLASKLYEARKNVVKRLNLRGEVAGGMLPGYHRYRDHMSIERYVEKVQLGELTDPTLTPQVRNGFRVKGILYDHITDPRSDNCAALIVRVNPYYNKHHSQVQRLVS
ncbi:MAG: GNAT family N-acetyltransferase [Anaerolineae bacterium]|nr:GNAT family N-acetyltransferase [Anaerolineae bacterium]